MRCLLRLGHGVAVIGLLVGSLAVLAAPDAGRAKEPGVTAEDRYIVVLRPGVADPRAAAAELGRAHGLSVGHVYDTVLNGFAARVPPQALAGLRRNPRVVAVEPDLTVSAAASLPSGVDRVGADDVGGTGAGPGPGAPVAVLDTGIAAHPDLTIAGGYNCASDDPAVDRGAWADGDGHGTHVAGIIGATAAASSALPRAPRSTPSRSSATMAPGGGRGLSAASTGWPSRGSGSPT